MITPSTYQRSITGIKQLIFRMQALIVKIRKHKFKSLRYLVICAVLKDKIDNLKHILSDLKIVTNLSLQCGELPF
jgi:hypothetical protein